MKFRSWIVCFTANKSTFAFEGNIAMYNLIILATTVLLKAPAPDQPQVIMDPAQGEVKKTVLPPQS